MELSHNPYGARKLWYFATPYSKYPKGMYAAYVEACVQGSICLAAGIPVFVPISHGHGIQNIGRKTAHTYEVWLNLDNLYLDACEGIIVCKMPGWEESSGIKHEIEYMKAVGKPVVYMDMNTAPVLP
jgi:nucleoside 2-deoxyribosyltransferase